MEERAGGEIVPNSFFAYEPREPDSESARLGRSNAQFIQEGLRGPPRERRFVGRRRLSFCFKPVRLELPLLGSADEGEGAFA